MAELLQPRGKPWNPISLTNAAKAHALLDMLPAEQTQRRAESARSDG
jgi:hypothetical protein